MNKMNKFQKQRAAELFLFAWLLVGAVVWILIPGDTKLKLSASDPHLTLLWIMFIIPIAITIVGWAAPEIVETSFNIEEFLKRKVSELFK